MSEVNSATAWQADDQPGVDHGAPTPPAVRRVTRSRTDRVFGGVCGGLGAYFRVDPVLLRVAAVALALSGGLGLIAYLIGWAVIPEDPEGTQPLPARPVNSHGASVAVGAALIALGALLLLRMFVPWFSMALFWPLVVVGAGVLILVSARR
jgi:phage shock protein C